MGQLANSDSAPSPYRHIFVRLQDIDAVVMTTSMQRTLSFDLAESEAETSSRLSQGASIPPHSRSQRSALTALIDSQSQRYAQAPTQMLTGLDRIPPSFPRLHTLPTIVVEHLRLAHVRRALAGSLHRVWPEALQ